MQCQDADIIASARQNLNNFAPIYMQHAKAIHDYCLARLQNETDAEDITSQVFVKAMTNLDRFESGSIRPWLFTIARNLIIDHVRKNKRTVDFDGEKLYEWDTSPIEKVIQSEKVTLIRQLVEKLPEDKKDLVLLRFVGELSMREISNITEKSEGALRVEIHRIIKQLRDQVQEAEEE